MICKNCGAHFDDHLPECPYCGQFSYSGAEKEYMDRLKNLKEDLEDLNETVPEIYTGEFQKQVKHTRKMILIISVLVLGLILLAFAGRLLLDSLYRNDAKAELLFTKEAFPIADEYYTSGDYEGLLNFYQTSISENRNASFYSWKHYSFLMCYENYDFFKQCAALIGTEELSEYDMTELFYCYIANQYYLKNDSMDPADRQLVSSYADEMDEAIELLSLTEEEQKIFKNLVNGADYPSWDNISKFGKQVYKRIY